MKIYTKTGDDGTTSLFNGDRVQKNSLRTTAYGAIDELNAIIGIVLSSDPQEIISSKLDIISNDLFRLGADLATPMESKSAVARISIQDITKLEEWIDEFEAFLPKLEKFVMPGGSSRATQLNLSRAVARRAEREIISLQISENIGDSVIIYINRLSDFLFVASRMANKLDGAQEKYWIHG